MRKIILDLCGGTGSWSEPYRARPAEYDVRCVTLPLDVRFYEPPSNVYGILAAPPCTMFSLARNGAKTERNLYEGFDITHACLRIIWRCRCKKRLAFWCLENPRGLMRQFLGDPVYCFEPFEFGHPWTKKTDLWGWFNSPRKGPILSPGETGFPSVVNVFRSQEKRAETPSGFARAFFLANQ